MLLSAIGFLVAGLWTYITHALTVELSFADGLLHAVTDGRVVLLLAPSGVDPLDDIDVTTSSNLFFGQNVYNISSSDTITLTGGGDWNTDTGVYGYPNVSLDAVATGTYSAQAFLTPYERVTRADGSIISVHFPCGDGMPSINGVGSLSTTVQEVQLGENPSSIALTFENVTLAPSGAGTEAGGCLQGDYEDTQYLKHVKIRSAKLSAFWNREIYVGANVLLPYDYDGSDLDTRYPVIYSQGHWPAGQGAFEYPTANFSSEWDNGVIKGKDGEQDRNTPKMILVTFRNEAPFYDNAHAVNTANLGPYGDAINDELIPYIDEHFNTIAKPYARIQEGGSDGGWISAASLIFRPDLFGACFSSYPVTLDFHSHQDIKLYSATNAYTRGNGIKVGSIRTFENTTEHVLATIEQENHWELTFGTSSRSCLQWDTWNTLFGPQGLNNYPLEPWDKVTGQIYPTVVEFWRENFDLANYTVRHWDDERNLGEVLKHRIFVYAGTHDDYYLNEGVIEFQRTVEKKGGPGWANITILSGEAHGGNYQERELWDYLELMYGWIQDHAPDGKTPLLDSVTQPSSRGNQFQEVIARGGRQAALARQSDPALEFNGTAIVANAGRWDSGVALQAQWKIDGEPSGHPFYVKQSEDIVHKPRMQREGQLQLEVVGTKRGYTKETRQSNVLTCLT